MKVQQSAWVTALVLLLLAAASGTPAKADERMVRKADNVFFCVDTSGSMMSDYMNGGSDLLRAREALARFVRAMPDLDYKTALYRFAPFDELHALAPHDEAALLGSSEKLPFEVPVFGNRTPLGDGLYDLAWPVSEVPGPTAVILFTDGGQNEGTPPLPVAEQLYANYDVCLHIVSFATKPSERAEVEKLAALNPCTKMVEGSELLSDPAKLEAFVRDTLWEMQPAPRRPAPKPAPKPEFHTVRVDLFLEFDEDKSDIRPEFHDEIAKVGELMARYPETTALIVGYADAVGTYEYNIRLSTDRAASVRDYLAERFGIGVDRLESVGYGENFPVQSNASEEGRQRNRRVTVYMTGWFVEE